MNASLKLVNTVTNTQLATRISQFAANINATCYWQLLDIALFDSRRAWAEQGSNSLALEWRHYGLRLSHRQFAFFAEKVPAETWRQFMSTWRTDSN